MRGGLPDSKVWPAERLFRLLTSSARPALPIASLSFAPTLALEVRAIRSAEEMVIRDVCDPDGRGYLEGMIAASVFCDGAKAFASTRDVGDLLEQDFDELVALVMPALDLVSPTYVRSDVLAWRAALKRGAAHGSNYGTVAALGHAFDWMGGTEQPDRFYGVPTGAIADGPMMAYHAAVGIVAEQRAKNK